MLFQKHEKLESLVLIPYVIAVNWWSVWFFLFCYFEQSSLTKTCIPMGEKKSLISQTDFHINFKFLHQLLF